MGKHQDSNDSLLFHRLYFTAIGATGFVGWLCWKGMEGRDEDMYKSQKYIQSDKKTKTEFNPDALLIERLKGGGAVDLRLILTCSCVNIIVTAVLRSKLRERTTELRQKIAEDHTVYNTSEASSESPSSSK